MSHARGYMDEAASIAARISDRMVDRLAAELSALRARRGRLYLAGMGGSAANCSHAASDLRKLCGINAVCLTDNVAELTSRINDEGADAALADMLDGDFCNSHDALMVFSVGGGTPEVSRCLVRAVDRAKAIGMRVLGVVGHHGGHVDRFGDCVVLVPIADDARVTPHTEAFQMVVLHCLVSHPDLQRRPTKW